MYSNIFYQFNGLNEKLFIAINNATNISFLPQILKIISNIFWIGNFAIYYIILCLICYFKTVAQKDNQYYYFVDKYYKLFVIGFTYAVFGFIYAGLKFTINMPRPFCVLNPEYFSTIIDTNLERCLSSFPSAHTGISVIIAYFLSPYFNKLGKLTLILMILIVATSRITLAMHYPADILYSVIIAGFIIYFSKKICLICKKIIIEPTGDLLFRVLFKS